jgi:hypothetical protein
MAGTKSSADLMDICSNLGEVSFCVPLNSGAGNCFFCDGEFKPMLTVVVLPSSFYGEGIVYRVGVYLKKLLSEVVDVPVPYLAGGDGG